MNRLTAVLTAFVAVMLMAGTSFAGGIDMGSWEEFTGLTSGTALTTNHLAGVSAREANGITRGPENIITLNYEAGEINYGTVGAGMKGSTEEHYGVAPAWSEEDLTSGTVTEAYEETPEMDLFLN